MKATVVRMGWDEKKFDPVDNGLKAWKIRGDYDGV